MHFTLHAGTSRSYFRYFVSSWNQTGIWILLFIAVFPVPITQQMSTPYCTVGNDGDKKIFAAHLVNN